MLGRKLGKFDDWVKKRIVLIQAARKRAKGGTLSVKLGGGAKNERKSRWAQNV